MKDVALIVFIKNFKLGTVKTRLSKTVGDEEALDVYTKLCTFMVEEVKKTGLQVYFYFSEFIDSEFLKRTKVNSNEDRYWSRLQTPGNLGIRMYHAFEEVLHAHEAAFILGTDCPYFSAKGILDAIHQLQSKETDMVIGPAKDGGYYGLGMKKLYDIFLGVDWSTDKVYKQTMEKVEEFNLKLNVLPLLNDIDYESDWIEFQKSSSASYFQEVMRSSSADNERVGE